MTVPFADVNRGVGKPLWLLTGHDKARAIVIFILGLLGFADAHRIAAPGIGKKAGKVVGADGVLADLDDGVPVALGNSGTSPAGARDGVAEVFAEEEFG